MIYAQIASRLKLHLVAEAGEEGPDGKIVRKGYVSQPLCGRHAPGYRMTVNLPLGYACQNCLRVWRSQQDSAPPADAGRLQR